MDKLSTTRLPAGGYAVVGVAAILRLAEDGTCQQAQIGLTGASTHATRASTVERALVGKVLTDTALAEASAHAADGLDLMADNYASSEFRAQLAPVEDQIKAALGQAPVLHVDETGVRRGGQLAWAHVASTARGSPTSPSLATGAARRPRPLASCPAFGA